MLTSNGSTNFYIDGNLMLTRAGTLAVSDSGTNTRFGAQYANHGEFFQGNIDYVRVYDSAITVTAAIPEPSTYALMLAGLGFVGFVAKRRRKSQAGL